MEDPKLAAMQHALAGLPRPDKSLFGDISGVPLDPDAVAAVPAAISATAEAAAALGRLAELVQTMDAALLGLNALLQAPLQPETQLRSGFIIEELPSDEPSPQAAQPADRAFVAVQLLLTVAQYGGDTALRRPWISASTDQACNQLLHALSAALPELESAHDPAPGISEAPISPAAGRAAFRLLAAALPLLLLDLRPAVTAYAVHAASETTRLELYAGPDSWQRCMAAGQLAWVVRHLLSTELEEVAGTVQPCLLAALEDPSPEVQACGLWALQHLAQQLPPADVTARSDALAAAVLKALRGCDERAWPAAAAAGVAVAGGLLKSNAYDAHAAALFAALLEEGERQAHNAGRSAVWLSAVPTLFPLLGLQLVRQFSHILPLLLEWCLGYNQPVQCAAVRAVQGVVVAAWPRMPAHAAIIWAVLERVHREEPGKATHAAPQAAARECVAALWQCGGERFRDEVVQRAKTSRGHGDKGGAGGSAALLEAALPHLPDASRMDVMLALDTPCA